MPKSMYNRDKRASEVKAQEAKRKRSRGGSTTTSEGYRRKSGNTAMEDRYGRGAASEKNLKIEGSRFVRTHESMDSRKGRDLPSRPSTGGRFKPITPDGPKRMGGKKPPVDRGAKSKGNMGYGQPRAGSR